MLPRGIRREIFEGLLANDIIGFHTRSYRWNFLQCCRDLMDLEVDFGAASCTSRTARCGCARTRCRSTRARRAASPRPSARASSRRSCCERRREHLILRVDRADLSKNVLRGFSAFDLFLEQHPEFRERVTFIAQLMPSRTDVPEYAEYLERIEALVAVVNHRHGTPDWMPIQLKLRDDLEEAMASYKHYDVLLVNAMFDGMNLVAKEGPLVNERDGVSILCENTGAHEELGEFALSRQPVRHPGDRRLDPRGADDGARGARAADEGPAGDRHRARPGRLDRRPARGHQRKKAALDAPRRRAALVTRSRTPSRGRDAARRPPGTGGGGRSAGALAPRGGAAPPAARRSTFAPRRFGRAPLRPRRAAPSAASRGSLRARAAAPRRAPPPPPAAATSAGAGGGTGGGSLRRRGQSDDQGDGGEERGRAARRCPSGCGGAGPLLPEAADGPGSPPRYSVDPPMADAETHLRPQRPARRRAPRGAARADPRRHRGDDRRDAGTIVSAHDWGRRKMAYEIKHKTDAEYHLIQFNGPRELLERLDRTLRITDGVIRYRIIKLAPGHARPAGSRSAVAAGHRRRSGARRATAAPSRAAVRPRALRRLSQRTCGDSGVDRRFRPNPPVHSPSSANVRCRKEAAGWPRPTSTG